jgi:hypothetical protein
MHGGRQHFYCRYKTCKRSTENPFPRLENLKKHLRIWISTSYDTVGIRILQLRRLAQNEQEPNVSCNVDAFVVLPSGLPDVHHSQKFRLLQ